MPGAASKYNLIEAFRSWAPTGLTGTWAATSAPRANPFAGVANVSFPKAALDHRHRPPTPTARRTQRLHSPAGE